MESLGEKLRTAREAKGINFDQISRETNIASRYLEALEKENFSGFPGEPYILGFLKNYGDYLGLDVQELLSLYRALKIQEQPIPVEQLLRSPRKFPLAAVVISGIILLALGGGGGAYYFLSRGEKAAPAAERRSMEYVLNTDSLERRFYEGDSVLVPLGNTQYKIELTNLGEALTLTAPSGTYMLDLSQELTMDLDDDGMTELRVAAADFVKNNAETGALLRFEIVSAPPSTVEGDIPVDRTSLPAALIFTSPQPYPFTFQAVFQGYCMFRWEILFERDRAGRNQQYFQRSDTLSIQAQNGIRLWASNAQMVKVQVIGGGRTVPVELGGAGEVVVSEMRWVRDEENRYRLVLTRLEQ